MSPKAMELPVYSLSISHEYTINSFMTDSSEQFILALQEDLVSYKSLVEDISAHNFFFLKSNIRANNVFLSFYSQSIQSVMLFLFLCTVKYSKVKYYHFAEPFSFSFAWTLLGSHDRDSAYHVRQYLYLYIVSFIKVMGLTIENGPPPRW